MGKETITTLTCDQCGKCESGMIGNECAGKDARFSEDWVQVQIGGRIYWFDTPTCAAKWLATA